MNDWRGRNKRPFIVRSLIKPSLNSNQLQPFRLNRLNGDLKEGAAKAHLAYKYDLSASKSDETTAELSADRKFLRPVNEYESAGFKQCRVWLLCCRRTCIRDKGADEGQATPRRVAP